MYSNFVSSSVLTWKFAYQFLLWYNFWNVSEFSVNNYIRYIYLKKKYACSGPKFSARHRHIPVTFKKVTFTQLRSWDHAKIVTHAPISLSICLSVCLFAYPSVCLSICLSVCLSVYLSVCLAVLFHTMSLRVTFSRSLTTIYNMSKFDRDATA